MIGRSPSVFDGAPDWTRGGFLDTVSDGAIESEDDMANPMAASETAEQQALMRWWAWQCPRWEIPERLLFAIPNGGDRNVLVGKRLKAEGVRRGIPDLFLAIPNESHAGMFLELKAERGRVSKEQKIAIAQLQDAGYSCVVCYGADEAIEAITQYLGKTETGV